MCISVILKENYSNENVNFCYDNGNKPYDYRYYLFIYFTYSKKNWSIITIFVDFKYFKYFNACDHILEILTAIINFIINLYSVLCPVHVCMSTCMCVHACVYLCVCVHVCNACNLYM